MIRLVASDMDGTLLDSYRQITEENISAIKELQNNGINFIINTGREYQNVMEILDKSGLKCDMLCTNGACGCDQNGNILFQHFIPKETVKKIFSIFRDFDLVPTPFSQDGRLSILSKEEMRQYIKDVMVPAMQINHPDFQYTPSDFQELLDNCIYVDGTEELLNGTHHNILKIISQSLNPDSLVQLRTRLEQELPELAVVSTVPTDIEITSKNAQKGIALMEYAKEKGYTPDEIVAIGDSENDYSMLSIPGLHSVAMENAAPMIQDICVYRTRANTNDGIAYIIKCILADRENFELL